MFQVQDFRSIVAAMINHMRSTQPDVTDFYVGSVVRTAIEAPAITLDEFYQRVLMGLLEAIPVAVYNAFGFDAAAAVSATGKVRFTYAGTPLVSVPIAAGTIITWPDTRLRYLVSSDSEIPAGYSWADIPVTAEFAGSAGNAPAGAVSHLALPMLNITGVVNTEDITGGAEAETAAERKQRFIDFVNSLSKGTVWAVTYAARYAVVLDDLGHIIERVSRIGMVEGAGMVSIYLYGSNGVPSEALVAAAQLRLDGARDPDSGAITPGYRAAGVQVTALAMSERSINVGLKLAMATDSEVDDGVYETILTELRERFAAVPSGQVLRVEQFTEAALAVANVLRAVTTNTVNEVCGAHEVLVPGEVLVDQIA